MEPASTPAPAPDESAPAAPAAAGTVPAAGGTVPAAPAAAGTVPAAGTTVPAEGPAPQPRLAAREGRRPRDMVMSLLVLLVPIALFMVYYQVVLEGDRPRGVKPESLASTLSAAEQVFPVTKATGLSSDWYITSAHFRREAAGGTLRLGYVDPQENPILMVQSNVPAATLVPAEVGAQGQRVGAYRTERRTWLRYTGKPGETALIVTEQDRTIVLLGNSPDTANLEKLAAALP